MAKRTRVLSRKRRQGAIMLPPRPAGPAEVLGTAAIAYHRIESTETVSVDVDQIHASSYISGLDTVEYECSPRRRTVEVEVPAAAVAAYQQRTMATNLPEALQSLVIEHAYQAYANGSGDNLGPATVRSNDSTGNYTIQFTWTGNAAVVVPNGWTTANSNVLLQGYDAGTTNAASIVSNWMPGDHRFVAPAGQALSYINYDALFDEHARQMSAPFERLPTARVQVINKKAQELLLQHLTEKQRQTWLAEKYFDLKVPSGRIYRLKHGMFHNVFLIDSLGFRVREYCAYADDPGGQLPVEDNLFAQMMTLMFNEAEFLRHANTWSLMDGRRVFVGKGRDADQPVEMAA